MRSKNTLRYKNILRTKKKHIRRKNTMRTKKKYMRRKNTMRTKKNICGVKIQINIFIKED